MGVLPSLQRRNGVIVIETNMFIFHCAPKLLNEDIIQRSAPSVHAHPNASRFYSADEYRSRKLHTWVKWVSMLTLCFYELLETLLEVGVMLLKPREDISDCVKHFE